MPGAALSPALWSEISRLLDEGLDLDPAARAGWLDTLKERAPAGAATVARLLAAHAQSETGDVLQRLRRGDRRIRRTNSWRAGSAEVSGQPWKAMLRLKAWQDEHGETLRKVPRRLRLEVAKRRG